MNGRDLDGSRLVVQIAGDRNKQKHQQTVDHKKGPQRDDLCFNCQEKGHWYTNLLFISN